MPVRICWAVDREFILVPEKNERKRDRVMPSSIHIHTQLTICPERVILSPDHCACRSYEALVQFPVKSVPEASWVDLVQQDGNPCGNYQR